VSLEDDVRRLEKMRMENKKPARNVRLKVEYFETEIDETAKRTDVAVPGTYPDVDFDKVQPQENGDKIAVVYPLEKE